ncbi:MAG: hypothetical protein ABSC41_17820 [Acidimicrobiales bacterium]
MSVESQSRQWTDPPHGASDHRARSQRDAALQRVRSITKAIALASVAGVVAIGIYVSRAVPRHSTTPASTGAGSTGAGTVGAGTGAGGSAAGSAPAGPATGAQQPSNLSPPDNPPAQTQQQAPVVSGAT